jgi:hypothetical protein
MVLLLEDGSKTMRVDLIEKMISENMEINIIKLLYVSTRFTLRWNQDG